MLSFEESTTDYKYMYVAILLIMHDCKITVCLHKSICDDIPFIFYWHNTCIQVIKLIRPCTASPCVSCFGDNLLTIVWWNLSISWVIVLNSIERPTLHKNHLYLTCLKQPSWLYL